MPLGLIKVVGLAVTYAIVPFLESDETADGQVMVELAMVLLLIEEDPRNGSFRPH